MKQSKKLLLRHYKFLERNHVPEDLIKVLRFYRESGNDTVFVLDGKLVVWNKEDRKFEEWVEKKGKR